MLQELIRRYGAGTVLTVRPYVLDSGETLRWVVSIDGEDVPDVDVRIDARRDPARTTMVLVSVQGELEIARWPTDGSEPAAIVETLGGL